MIFRLPEHCLEQELELIWTREMIGGLYIPVWADVLLSNGDTVKALVFVSDQGILVTRPTVLSQRLQKSSLMPRAVLVQMLLM